MKIQLLMKHGMRLGQITPEMGYAVNMIRRHLAMKDPPKHERSNSRKNKLSDINAIGGMVDKNEIRWEDLSLEKA